MANLDLSLITVDKFPPDLDEILQKFQSQNRISLDLEVYTWDNAWSELMKIAIYTMGPDVSQVGTTWIDSLLTLKALKKFNATDINKIGGSKAFLDASWNSEKLTNSVWAIPYVSDTRIVYYRRDLLAQAGIDEAVAFSNLDQFEKTIHQLAAYGYDMPLAMSSNVSKGGLVGLLDLASWIWTSGGSFTDEHGYITFDQPEALSGAIRYYKLINSLPKAAQNLTDFTASRSFLSGKAAVNINNANGRLPSNEVDGSISLDVEENIGVASLPGVPFVGGSNLVIWKHSKQVAKAMKLIQFLTSHQTQKLLPSLDLLPARKSVLADETFVTDPYYKVVRESLESGRAFKAMYGWGLIETKLLHTMSEIGKQLFSNPNLDVEAVVTKAFKDIASELKKNSA